MITAYEVSKNPGAVQVRAVERPSARPAVAAFEDHQLMMQSEVLEHEIESRCETGTQAHHAVPCRSAH